MKVPPPEPVIVPTVELAAPNAVSGVSNVLPTATVTSMLPIVVAASTGELEEALNRLDSVGGYGYVATLKKNLFSFNPKMLSKRAGLIDENGNLLKAARIPKK